MIRESVNTLIIPDPTDNLILPAILDHAQCHPGAMKVILTENTKDFDLPEVKEALVASGVGKSFRSMATLLGWLGSLGH